MVDIREKADCSGCAACANVCPSECIDMKTDTEGFLYPSVDFKKCIACNQCETVCPILNQAKEIPFEQQAFLVHNRDEQIRQESTSGGAFTAIAQEVIRQGGVVFGAAFDEEFHVRHQWARNESELKKFRNSKYVQSEIGDSYKQAKKFLEDGRTVCFSGTPCQIEGLLHFLQKSYQKLLTVDVVCRAVPSPMLFQKYLAFQKRRYTELNFEEVFFRDKSFYGYRYSQLSLRAGGGRVLYHQGIDSDPWLRAFFSNICDRPSCYCCHFRKRYRSSDFTIWDCFEPDRYYSPMDDGKGTSKLLIHSEKGRNFFEPIQESMKAYPITADEATNEVREMFHSIPQNPKRQQFFEDAVKLSEKELFNTYFPDSIKVRLERVFRKTAYRLNIYKYVRKFYKLMTEKRKLIWTEK